MTLFVKLFRECRLVLTSVPKLWVGSTGRLTGTLIFATSKAPILQQKLVPTTCLATWHVEISSGDVVLGGISQDLRRRMGFIFSVRAATMSQTNAWMAAHIQR